MVSIIVPVYNAQKCIDKCLASIIGQSYENWELILVDDGSKDESFAICKAYAQKDARIRVIHTENRGVSSARNTGLDIACGEYVTFVDSDDTVHPDFLSECLQTATDLIVANYEQPNDVKESHYVEATPCIVFQQNAIRPVWGKVYCRKIIEENHLRFDTDIRFAEDTIFVLQYCLHIHTVAYVFKHLYMYDEPPYYTVYKYKTSLDEYLNILGILQGLTTKLKEKSYEVKVLVKGNVDNICWPYMILLYETGRYRYAERKLYIKKFRALTLTHTHWGLIKVLQPLSIVIETSIPFILKDCLLKFNFLTKECKRCIKS